MYSYKRERAKRLYPEPAIFNMSVEVSTLRLSDCRNKRRRVRVDVDYQSSLAQHERSLTVATCLELYSQDLFIPAIVFNDRLHSFIVNEP